MGAEMRNAYKILFAACHLGDREDNTETDKIKNFLDIIHNPSLTNNVMFWRLDSVS
jgi:hypothetical protein